MINVHNEVDFQSPYYQTVKTVFNRLVETIQKRYGCDLHYFSFEKETEKSKAVKSLINKDRPVVLDGFIFFPIYIKEELVGCAQIPKLKEFTQNDIEKLKESISLVIESTIMSASSLNNLIRLEKQLLTQEEPENVVRIDRSPRRQKINSNEQRKFKKYNFSIPCLIEAKDYFDSFRMASEIHLHSNRFAFVNLSDLDEMTRTDVTELRRLGPVTVFIEEIAELSEVEQATLLEYLDGPRSKDSPQIIASTVFSYGDLKQKSFIRSQLLSRLSTAYLKMDKSFHEYLEGGVIDFFYDSLTRSPDQLDF